MLSAGLIYKMQVDPNAVHRREWSETAGRHTGGARVTCQKKG